VFCGNGSTTDGNTYTINWQTAVPGQYILTAVAVDALGLTTVSAPVPITLLSRLTNSPVMQVFVSRTNPVPNGATINDGITSVGTPAVTLLTISNAGNAALSISTLMLSDTNDFSISNNFALPLSLPAGSATNLALFYNAHSSRPGHWRADHLRQ